VLDKNNGKFIHYWGQAGVDQPGDLYFPRAVVFYDYLLYISDDCRIQVFTKEGLFLQYVGVGGSKSRGDGFGQFNNPYGLCLVPLNNRLYVADNSNHRIQVFS